MPPGWSGLARHRRPLHLQHVGLHDQPQRPHAHLRPRLSTRTRALYQTDVLPRGPNRSSRAGQAGAPAVPVGRPTWRPITRTAVDPAPQRADRAARAAAPRTHRERSARGGRASFNEARHVRQAALPAQRRGRSSRPTRATIRANAARPPGIAARGRRGRERDRGRTAQDAASSTTPTIVFTSDNGYMQGEHRVPPARCCRTSPRPGCRSYLRGPGIPRGAVIRRARGERGPRADAAGARRRDRRQVGRRALAAAVRARAGAAHEAGDPARDRRTALRAAAREPGRAHEPSPARCDRVLTYRAVRTRALALRRYRDGGRRSSTTCAAIPTRCTRSTGAGRTAEHAAR